MKLTLDLAHLRHEGHITPEPYQELSALAVRDTGSVAFNILVGSGVMAVAGAALALVPNPFTALTIGALLMAASLYLLTQHPAWLVLANICTLVAALTFGGGALILLGGTITGFFLLAAIFLICAVVVRSALLGSLSVLSVVGAVGAGTFYRHAVYEVTQMFGHISFTTATLLTLIVLTSTSMVMAETVEVYPSIQVTKHTYDAPLNEQPFYGFSPKSEAMLAADRKFIDAVEKNTGREVGAEQFEAMGWNALKNSDFSTAAKRFNQAWLLEPGRSASVHGLALVAAGRFGDLDFAIELASVAAGLRDPLPALSGDRGGLLIRAGKPDQAIPFLEKAAQAMPDWINPQINLATARFETGDVPEGCRQLAKVERMMQDRPGARSPAIESTYRSLSKEAQCVPL